tara:strand:+ start:554 stop:784 length:231 start_codon:yes stop_codon:yes gene_type:complete
MLVAAFLLGMFFKQMMGSMCSTVEGLDCPNITGLKCVDIYELVGDPDARQPNGELCDDINTAISNCISSSGKNSGF